MSPWTSVAFASAAAAVAFFVAGFLFSNARGRAPQPAARPQGGASDIHSLLALLVQTTGSEAAALLDADGLLVAGSGRADASAQAMAASVLKALLELHHHGLADVGGAFELNAAGGRPIRVRLVSSGERPYLVTTLGTEGQAAPELEDRIAAGIPRLIRAA